MAGCPGNLVFAEQGRAFHRFPGLSFVDPLSPWSSLCHVSRAMRHRSGDNIVPVETEGLPGADLVEEGLADVSRGVESVPSLLVSIGAPRLRLLGFEVPAAFPRAEERLYALLGRDGADAAHGRYNALVRTLVSFERAAAVRRRAA